MRQLLDSVFVASYFGLWKTGQRLFLYVKFLNLEAYKNTVKSCWELILTFQLCQVMNLLHSTKDIEHLWSILQEKNCTKKQLKWNK